MSFAVSVQNVSKRYRLGEISRGQLLADLHRWWMKRRAPGAAKKNLQAVDQSQEEGDFWALKDLCFDIKQGETLGIIGANGAGKSTLLKIISRITAPTTGSVKIRGRIGSLLEVGTGFHQDLTGRDNVFLNGAILGMNRAEVKSKFDEIVAFSGLEQFIDTPVKRYSSGMYVRLAFSVAAFLEPEILIIDEVLSVGDEQFQKQSMQRMEQIINDGRTLIFVSHGAFFVRQVCRRAICLEHGNMIFDGDVDDAFAAYAESENQKAENKQASGEPEPGGQPTCVKEWHNLSTAPGNENVKLQAARVLDIYHCEVETISTTQWIYIEIEFVVLQSGKFLQPTLLFTDRRGNTLFWSTDTNPELRRTPRDKGKYKSTMQVPADFLAPGKIFIHIAIVEMADEVVKHATAVAALSINVIEDFSENSVRGGYNGIIPGLLRPRMKWVLEEVL